MRNPLSDPASPNVLAVVGENNQDPLELLLQGADGEYYGYHLPEGHTRKVVLDDQWQVDPIPGQHLFS